MSLAKNTRTMLSKQTSRRFVSTGVFSSNEGSTFGTSLFKPTEDTVDMVEVINDFIADGLLNLTAGTVTSVVHTLSGVSDLTTAVNGVNSNTVTLPTSVPVLNNGNIFVGDATNTAVGVVMSSHATIDNLGAVTVRSASDTQTGIVELGTSAETETGTDTLRVPTLETLALRYPKKSVLTTKGDLYVASATSIPTRIGVSGNSDSILVEDSSTATGWRILRNDFTFTVAPTAANDNTQGYGVGSTIVDTVANIPYICVDASTGAAVWVDLTSAANANITEGTLNNATGARTVPMNSNSLTFSNLSALTASGITGNVLLSNTTGAFTVQTTTGTILLTDGANYISLNGNTDIINLNAANGIVFGDGAGTNLPTLDSDSTDEIVTVDANGLTGRFNANAVKVVVLGAAPVDGTTVAYEVGQLFWDNVNKVLHEATAKSTDPDAAGTGSTFAEVNFKDGYHRDISRPASVTVNVAPTVGEYAAPVDGSSCHITLANGNIEHWNYNTAWTLQSTQLLGGYAWFDTGVKDIKIEANQDPTSWITETAVGTYDIVEPLGGSVRSISWIQEITATAQQNAPAGTIIFNLDTSANGGNTGTADAGSPNAYGKATNDEVFGFRSVNAPGAPFTASAAGGVLTMQAAGMSGIWDDGSKMYIENIKNV